MCFRPLGFGTERCHSCSQETCSAVDKTKEDNLKEQVVQAVIEATAELCRQSEQGHSPKTSLRRNTRV